MTDKLNPQEALVGFITWLSTQDGSLKIGSSCDIAPWIKKVKQFSEANKLDSVTDQWTTILFHPNGEVEKNPKR